VAGGCEWAWELDGATPRLSWCASYACSGEAMSVNFAIWGSCRAQPPICRICTGGDEPRIVLVQRGEGVRHWPYEGHNRTETHRTESPRTQKRTGRPKKWENEAERLKAYRRKHEHQS